MSIHFMAFKINLMNIKKITIEVIVISIYLSCLFLIIINRDVYHL